jgi:hypothetical protein
VRRVDPALPIVGTAVVWNREEQDVWKRYLVREQKGALPIVESLIEVRAGVPVCFVCLSTDVEVAASERFLWGELSCRGCGVQYGIIP